MSQNINSTTRNYIGKKGAWVLDFAPSHKISRKNYFLVKPFQKRFEQGVISILFC